MQRLTIPLILLASAAAAFLLGRLTIPGALYGWDSYPLIAASRFDSVGAFFGTFAEELMDGRYPKGAFFRPVLHLMLGAEYAAGGAAPWVYGLVNVVVAMGAGVAVALAARRLGIAAVAAGLAGGFLLLNPLADHVTWFMPRRPESLVVLFTGLALAVQRKPGESGAAKLGLGFLCALLSAGSKESGVLVAPLVVTLHLFERGVKGGIKESLPVVLAVGLYMVARTIVLGGLGGHPESEMSNFAATHTFAAGQLELAYGIEGGLALAGVLAPLALIPLLGLPRKESRVAVLVPLVWLLGNLVLVALSGVVRAWYAYQLIAPLALLAAAGSTLGRWRALPGLATAALLCLPIVRGGAAPDRTEIEETNERFLASYAEMVQGAKAGDTMRITGWRKAGVYPRVQLFLQARYSLEAYSELLDVPPTRCLLMLDGRPFAPDMLTVVVVLAPDQR